MAGWGWNPGGCQSQGFTLWWMVHEGNSRGAESLGGGKGRESPWQQGCCGQWGIFRRCRRHGSTEASQVHASPVLPHLADAGKVRPAWHCVLLAHWSDCTRSQKAGSNPGLAVRYLSLCLLYNVHRVLVRPTSLVQTSRKKEIFHVNCLIPFLIHLYLETSLVIVFQGIILTIRISLLLS